MRKDHELHRSMQDVYSRENELLKSYNDSQLGIYIDGYEMKNSPRSTKSNENQDSSLPRLDKTEFSHGQIPLSRYTIAANHKGRATS